MGEKREARGRKARRAGEMKIKENGIVTCQKARVVL
jgi:hypothetical protein